VAGVNLLPKIVAIGTVPYIISLKVGRRMSVKPIAAGLLICAAGVMWVASLPTKMDAG